MLTRHRILIMDGGYDPSVLPGLPRNELALLVAAAEHLQRYVGSVLPLQLV
jgi:hypothetical protein